MAELSKAVYELFVELADPSSHSPPPRSVESMHFQELNVVLEMQESDLDGWSFVISNSDLLSSAKIYCKFEKRKRVKDHVFSLTDPSEYDIELYALEFGFPYSKAKALLFSRKR